MSNMNEDYAEVRARNKELQRCVRKEYERAERLLDERNRFRGQIERIKAENQRLRDQLAAIKREWQYGTDEVHATPWRRRMAWLIGDEESSLPHMGTVGDGGRITWDPPLKDS